MKFDVEGQDVMEPFGRLPKVESAAVSLYNRDPCVLNVFE